jgi:hypothetical protein
MYESMVNPVLTILFDLFLVGSALAIAAAMAAEYLVTREPHVGTSRPKPPIVARAHRRHVPVHRMPAQRRRAA